MTDDANTKSDRNAVEGECTIPEDMPIEVMSRYALAPQNEYEADDIRRYVEGQTGDEVVHLEKVKTEPLLGNQLSAWDVWCKKDRYWVITKPMQNLYQQQHFKSLDYTISFHIGLMQRIVERQSRDPNEGNKGRLLEAWRRFYQGVEMLDAASEAADFQALGNCCREVLLTLCQFLQDSPVMSTCAGQHKRSDFVHWMETAADVLSPGSSGSETRSYLKSLSKSAWQFVSWLVHAKNATLIDGFMALSSTDSVISAFELVLHKIESGLPERCPGCNSYQVRTWYQPTDEGELHYLNVCDACNWESERELVLD